MKKLSILILLALVFILLAFTVVRFQATASADQPSEPGQHRPVIWMPILKVECVRGDCAYPVIPDPPVCDRDNSRGVCE